MIIKDLNNKKQESNESFDKFIKAIIRKICIENGISYKDLTKHYKRKYLRRKSMKNLGFVNGWIETPEELKKCRELGHDIIIKKIGYHLDEYRCDICKYKYQVDSSG
jgi:hypothetical protein